MDKKGKTYRGQRKHYSHGNLILPNSFNVKDFEQMKIAGNIIDYEIDDKGVKLIKRMDITSVSI